MSTCRKNINKRLTMIKPPNHWRNVNLRCPQINAYWCAFHCHDMMEKLFLINLNCSLNAEKQRIYSLLWNWNEIQDVVKTKAWTVVLLCWSRGEQNHPKSSSNFWVNNELFQTIYCAKACQPTHFNFRTFASVPQLIWSTEVKRKTEVVVSLRAKNKPLKVDVIFYATKPKTKRQVWSCCQVVQTWYRFLCPLEIEWTLHSSPRQEKTAVSLHLLALWVIRWLVF